MTATASTPGRSAPSPPRRAPSQLPPGPRAPRWLQTYLWLTRPTWVFERCARLYGDPFMLNVMLAGNLVYTADPGVVREVFKGDPRRFHPGDAYILIEPAGGPTSLFLLDEDRHLRMRLLLLPQC